MAYLESVIATPITVNIQVSYGEVAGQPLQAGSLGESDPLGSYFTYAQLKSALTAVAASPQELASVASLPASDPTNGGDFFVNTAEQKALGLLAADDTGIDGYVGLSSAVSYTFDPNNRAVAGLYDAIGILEHEITEVLGRDATVGEAQTNATNIYSPLDLFRYSAPGVHDLTPAADYFSVDGQTLLSQFDDALQNGGDPGDWAPSVAGDSFDAFAEPGVQLGVSATDLAVLDVLGFHPGAPAAPAPPATPTPTVVAAPALTLSGSDTIAAGQALYTTGVPLITETATVTLASSPSPVAFANSGTISVSTDNLQASEVVALDSGNGNATIVNAKGGALYALNTAPATGSPSLFGGVADGFTGYAQSFDNAGLIQAVSLNNAANGYFNFVEFQSFTNEASGVIRVWAGGAGVGVQIPLSGSFNNAGLIEVTAQSPVGVEGGIGGITSFTNSGVIETTDINGGAGGIGVDIGPNLPTLVNSGTISADDAIVYDASEEAGVTAPFAITNSGHLIGDILLEGGADTIHNTGQIKGDIYFGPGNGVYDGAGGTLTGAIHLGFGTNTVTLGADGETVYGGFGSDTITGGAGNDFIEIGGGNNTVDGGGGFNVLSFADSATGVTVDLGKGVATDDGADTIKNIQEVIGSGHDDTLIAGAAAATLVAGAGHDTLIGGAGNDTLVAGTGGDTMTGGGGDNTFVYSAGDQALVVTDFDAGGDADVLRIYGYASAQSVTQQGANALITLGDGDSILLDGVQASSLGPANLVFSEAAYPGFSLPPSPPAYGTNPILAVQALTIAADDVIDETAQPYAIVDEGFAFTNNGQISVSFPVAQLSDQVFGYVEEAGPATPAAPSVYTVTNSAGASLNVSALEGGAVGFAIENPDTLVNAGDVTVTAAGDAAGAELPLVFDNKAGAHFDVTSSAGAAYAIEDGPFGATQLENDGEISVHGATAAYGLLEDGAQISFTNTGTFTVQAAPGAPSVALQVGGGGDYAITNSGTISAVTAVQMIDAGDSPTQYPYIDLTNSGVIDGDIVLVVPTSTPDGDVTVGTSTIAEQIHNTGAIHGDISFADGGVDIYDGAAGTESGVIFLGWGTSTVTLGADGETVVASPLGGVNTITGGAGNDFIEIGRGTNTVDGGGGFNTVSFAEAGEGVTVNLGTGQASAAGTDTLKNIQRVIGSSFDDTLIAGAASATLIAGSGHDTLTGGAGNDTLVAGAGGDTMTGGGGNNTFIYSAGDHQLVVTDFGAGGDQDVLDIDGYASAQSIQQQGADTLITLSSTDSILLQNVQAASLGAELVFSPTPYQPPAAPPTPALFGTSEIAVFADLTILPGETLNISGPASGFAGIADNASFQNGENSFHSVTNYGDVQVNSTGGQVTGFNAGEGVASALFTNEPGATFAVSATGGNAFGFFSPSFSPDFDNYGTFTVTASATAWGVDTWDGNTSFPFEMTNAAGATLAVTGGADAYGVASNNDAQFENDGTLIVRAGGDAYGFWADAFDGTLINTGTILVSGASSYAFSTSGFLQTATLDNSGTMTGEYVFDNPLTQQPMSDLAIDNTGVMNGNIAIGASNRTSIVDTGTINGDIELSMFASTIDLRGGQFNGSIIVDPATDYFVATTIYTGANNTTIQVDAVSGQPAGSNQVTVHGGTGDVTVEFDVASSQATVTQNADGSETVNAGPDGTATLYDVQSIVFSGQFAGPIGPTPEDFYAAGTSDILFGQADGSLAIWELNGTSLIGGGPIGDPGGTWSVVGTGNFFTNPVTADILFQDATGDLALWRMAGTSIVGGGSIGSAGGTWDAIAVGNFTGAAISETQYFTGNGFADILFRDASGDLAIWEMSGMSLIGGGNIGNPGGTWSVIGVGDFTGSGKDSILFHDAAGDLAIWEMNGTQIIGGGTIGNPGGTWAEKGIGDFNGDGRADILFEDAQGDYALWEMNGTTIIGGGDIGNPGPNWSFAGVGDYNGDGHADILFTDAAGDLAIWEMNGTSIIGGGEIGNPGSIWHVLG